MVARFLFALSVSLVLLLSNVGAEEAASSCGALLQEHKNKHPKEASPLKDADGSQQMVYFLHVPRTAGRTFHSCFLKLGTQPQKRCPKVSRRTACPPATLDQTTLDLDQTTVHCATCTHLQASKRKLLSI
jgi:hypothetical protein